MSKEAKKVKAEAPVAKKPEASKPKWTEGDQDPEGCRVVWRHGGPVLEAE